MTSHERFPYAVLLVLYGLIDIKYKYWYEIIDINKCLFEMVHLLYKIRMAPGQTIQF